MHNTIHTSLVIPLREPCVVLLWNRTCHGLASPLPWVKGSSAGEEIGLLAEMMEEREAEGSGSEVKVVSCWEGEWLFSW